ncbi:MAG: HD domain-containing protein [Clostridiaceae bacterium]|nr:HD domain-containing protein [Clostridiaceae bacterium]
MDDKRLTAQLAFLVELDRMKTIERQSPIYAGGRRENDAEHSWHIAVMAMVLREYAAEPVDMGHVLEMLTVHDLIEIYAGDTFAYDAAGNSDKAAREAASADRLYAMLPEEQGAYYRALWEEFDAMETPDARFAASLDRFQPLLSNWLNEGGTWRVHNVHPEQVYRRMEPLKTGAPKLWELADRIIRASVARGHLQ